MDRKNKGFFVYNEYITPAYKALSLEQFKDFLLGMVLYGINGSYPPINPIAEAFLLQVIHFIDKYDRKYTRALKGGARGGRKPKVTKDEIQYAIQHHGILTTGELAEYFHCSERTIYRYITNEKIIQSHKEIL